MERIEQVLQFERVQLLVQNHEELNDVSNDLMRVLDSNFQQVC